MLREFARLELIDVQSVQEMTVEGIFQRAERP